MLKTLALLWVDDEIEKGIKNQIKGLLLDGYYCKFRKDDGQVVFLYNNKEETQPIDLSKKLLTLRFTKYWDVALEEITSVTIKVTDDDKFSITSASTFEEHNFDVSVIDIFLEYRDSRIRTELEGYLLVFLADMFKADKTSKVIAVTGHAGRIADSLDKLLIQHVAEHFIRESGEYVSKEYNDKDEAIVAKGRHLAPVILKQWKNKVYASISLYEKGKIIETLNTIMNNFSSYNFSSDVLESFFDETVHWLDGSISSLYHLFLEEIKTIVEIENERKFDTTMTKLLDPLCEKFRVSKVATLAMFYEAHSSILHPSPISNELNTEKAVKALLDMQHFYLNKENDLEHLGNEVQIIIDKIKSLPAVTVSVMNSLIDKYIKKYVRLIFYQKKSGYTFLQDIVQDYCEHYRCSPDLKEHYCFTDVITFKKGFCSLLKGIKERGGEVESVQISKIDDKAIIKIKQAGELELEKMKQGYGTSDWANQLYQCCDFRLQSNGVVYRWYANEACEVSGVTYLENADFVLEFR